MFILVFFVLFTMEGKPDKVLCLHYRIEKLQNLQGFSNADYLFPKALLKIIIVNNKTRQKSGCCCCI